MTWATDGFSSLDAPRRREVFSVKIGGFQHVQQRKVAADPFVEPFDLIGRRATFGRDELDPAVSATIQ